MNNPIFDFIGEGMVISDVLKDMGFHSRIHEAFLDEDDPEFAGYLEGSGTWLDDWKPNSPSGFELVMKFDSEDGPVAVFAKPFTKFAKLLLEFGNSQAAQDAARTDHERQDIEWKVAFNNIHKDKGELLYPHVGLEDGGCEMCFQRFATDYHFLVGHVCPSCYDECERTEAAMYQGRGMYGTAVNEEAS